MAFHRFFPLPTVGVCVGVALILAVSGALPAAARLGVGVGAGKMIIEESLQPGGSYQLPALPVLNTGDETSEYGISIEYHHQQPEHRPVAEWFFIRPNTFTLAPGESQVVSLELTLPPRAEAGEYFAYVEAHPLRPSTGQGGAHVGVAAAAKLRFTVAPSTVAQGLYLAALTALARYAPWPTILLTVVLAGGLFVWIRRTFHIGVRLRKK